MIDWMTIKIDAMDLPQEAFDHFRKSHFTLVLVDPQGNCVWEKPARDSVRSDSHQLTVEFGSELTIYGSPARLMTGDNDNVFGSDNPVDCAGAMIRHVARTCKVQLPGVYRWKCTRIDVTENYDMGSDTNVKQALELLRHAEGGRYQVKTTAETVYWSTASTYRSGKAYSKGPHLQYLIKRGKLEGISDEKLQAASRLLRLELSLRRHWFQRISRKPWHSLTPSDLAHEHEAYFSKLIGDCEVTETMDMQKKFAHAAVDLGLTPGQGRAAYASWKWIEASGYNDWRDGMPRTTFYRHKKIMMAAGLSLGDFAARTVVPIRRRRLVIDRPVKSWSELLRVA